MNYQYANRACIVVLNLLHVKGLLTQPFLSVGLMYDVIAHELTI